MEFAAIMNDELGIKGLLDKMMQGDAEKREQLRKYKAWFKDWAPSAAGTYLGSILMTWLTYKATGWKRTKSRSYLIWNVWASLSSIGHSLGRIEKWQRGIK